MQQPKIYTHSPYTGAEYDASNTAYKWNVIITADFPPNFYKIPHSRQAMIDIQYTPLNEIDFINHILEGLPTHYLFHLIKISACHIGADEEHPYPKWMKKRNGKFYFNTDINGDKDTKFWNRKRNECLEKRINNVLPAPFPIATEEILLNEKLIF
jgi:hypothetical protein